MARKYNADGSDAPDAPAEDVVSTKPDTGWSMIPPLNTPHAPKPDQEFSTVKLDENGQPPLDEHGHPTGTPADGEKPAAE